MITRLFKMSLLQQDQIRTLLRDFDREYARLTPLSLSLSDIPAPLSMSLHKILLVITFCKAQIRGPRGGEFIFPRRAIWKT